MARLYLKRTLSGFAPADADAETLMRKFTVGECYKAEVTRPRNLKTHRRYWALVNLVYQNTEQFTSPDQLHQYLKIRAGHCDQIVSKSTGEIFLIARSINFDTLDEQAFQEVWSRICDVVSEEIIPGLDMDELQLEVEKLIGMAA